MVWEIDSIASKYINKTINKIQDSRGLFSSAQRKHNGLDCTMKYFARLLYKKKWLNNKLFV